ncbi:hypothetical protein B9N43_02650 [Denitratisoma sp. DHT3]|uniref:AraC family transcriptional regulator n=1 Tax=Denitratisoma sp. DHT3 TaxID=1981880 RepID=UPI0011989E05|nr:AraC family transcriptional regulator [Denitratisoma sp. DHT3]QDX80258.1 hypothetical protein B9N43_02650 [Denitratisoma sp. DHT3]
MTHAVPGIKGFPLGAATRLRCDDPMLAERTVSNLIEPRRLVTCGGRRPADIRISHVAMDLGHLFGVAHGAAVTATSGPIGSYQVMVPLRGSLVGHTRHGEIAVAPGSALVYSPRDCLDTYWSEECISVVLSIPGERLRALARDAFPGLEAGPLPLRPRMALGTGCGRSFANALGVICQESVDPESAFSRGMTTRSIEQTLLLSLLTAQAESAAPRQLGGGANGTQCHAYLARALALIDARCDEDIGIADLVRAAGVSLRTLQYGFMERFGIGPATYLKQARLRRVHDALRAADPARCNVGDVAARWGFYHGSVFARAYRKLFGELPSQTLARGR